MALDWHQTFAVLREKSTIAGLVGLGFAIMSAVGHELGPEHEAVVTEVVLAIISIVAIATRPKPPSRYDKPETWHDRREDHIDAGNYSRGDRGAGYDIRSRHAGEKTAATDQAVGSRGEGHQ